MSVERGTPFLPETRFLNSTLNLAAAARLWDVVVVGAGPAGALSAREIARRGASVLLVDKAHFPRWKICGCCLNARALGALAQVGLASLPRQRGGVPLSRFCLAANGRRATVGLPGGVSISRQNFDAGLVEEAIVSGAEFLPGTHARSCGIGAGAPEYRQLLLRQEKYDVVVAAKLVIAADGLGGRFLAAERIPQSPGVDAEQRHEEVASNSRIGSGVIAETFPPFYDRGVIFMACAAGGYVGLVRLEDGRLDIATALDPFFVKQARGLGEAAATIVAEAGFPPIPRLEALGWRGTPLLTRRILRPAGQRVFAVGDAAGYIEPFTGEGISWALASGVAVAPLARRACQAWDETLAARWCVLYHRTISRRQRFCRLVAEVLRHPRLTGWLVAGMARMPALANPVVRYLNFVPTARFIG